MLKRVFGPRVAGAQLPFYGWAVAMTAMVSIFASAPGQSYGFSIFIDAILADTGLTRTELSALYALGTGVSAVTTLLVGRMVDRWGARVMLSVVGVGFGAACFVMAGAGGMGGVLLGFALLRALGQGSLAIIATLLIAQWFARYRGRAMALVQFGAAASNALFPPLALGLLAALGWRDAYRVLGVLVWVLIVPAAILVVRNQPEALGLHPDGLPESPDQPSPVARQGVTVDSRVWRTSAFWLLALPMTAAPFLITALVFHQTSILAARGLAPTVAASIFVAMAGASTVTSALTGYLLDRINPKIILYVTLGLLLLALVELQFISTPLGAFCYAITLGSAGGMQGVTSGVIWAHYYGRHGLGKIQGTATMVSISAAAIAPLPLAMFQQIDTSYGLGLLVYAALPVACAAILAFGQRARQNEANR